MAARWDALIIVIFINLISTTVSLVSLYQGRNFLTGDRGFPGRAFGFFNLMPMRVNRMEFAQLSAKVTGLETRTNVLTNQVRVLTAALSNLSPECPDTATGAEVVGNLCYTVETSMANFDSAGQMCIGKGGKLAEPSPGNSQTFYNQLAGTFPTEINTIKNSGNSEFWIGIVHPITAAQNQPFQYLSSGVGLLPTNSIFNNVLPLGNDRQGVVLVVPGNVWKAVDDLETRAFVCEYNLTF